MVAGDENIANAVELMQSLSQEMGRGAVASLVTSGLGGRQPSQADWSKFVIRTRRLALAGWPSGVAQAAAGRQGRWQTAAVTMAAIYYCIGFFIY